MKTIYSVYLSEDGLWKEAFSNKKALYNFIEISLQGYENCRYISLFDKSLPLTYNNLLKAFNKYGQFEINDGKYGSEFIRIQELNLLSK